MARKREEKASQNSSNNDQKSHSKSSSPGKDKNFISLKHQLLAMKLTLREIPGDGNCLFGALADQLDGTPKTHHKHRQDVVSYMRHHREDFEPFVEDDVPFERHLGNLAELGTYGGNECIVAFARLNKVKVVIHQLNTPLWQIDGSEGKENVRELHISYHNGDHYNSVRRTGDCSAHPTNIKLTVKESPISDDPKKESSKGYKDYSTYYYSDDCDASYNADEMMACAGESLNINYVMEKTGCQDLELVRKFLEMHEDNVQEAIYGVTNFFLHDRNGEPSSTLWSPNGTGARIFGQENEVSQASCQRKSSQDVLQDKIKNMSISNSKRKELQKKLRKQQNLERKRNCSRGTDNCAPDSDESGETTIVKDLGCLSI